MLDVSRPFVLLDDVAAGRATLFTEVGDVLTTEQPAAVPEMVSRLRGGDWAGFLGFEAGYALEPKLGERASPSGEPLMWFGRFGRVETVQAASLLAEMADARSAAAALQPGWTAAEHGAALAEVQALIAAGDVYQVNLTFTAHIETQGHPLALYRALRAGSRAPFGALVFTGDHWLLSFSPELFFSLKGGQLVARPMKGTAPRAADAAEDAMRAAALAADPKNRAENLMIVDLLRNDLSRVGTSVEVPRLFDVERYPTVLQMTSTVTADLRLGLTAADVLASLFPCGSVTGAPKIRAMEVIAEVESGPRGVYTGSIGAVRSDGDAIFNVAIRTLVLPAVGRTARLGLGSGIVNDSEAAAEWQECLDKAVFLRRRGPPDLVETMRCEAGALPDLERHLARLTASADFLGLRFDPAEARALLASALMDHDGRVRLLLAASGAMAVQLSPQPAIIGEPVPVALVALPVLASDWRLRHKSMDRAFYETARADGGAFEALLVRPDELVTEGSFTNVFIERDGRLVTPAAGLGLLPGILRARLLDEGRAAEGEVRISDLQGEFFIGNALRGLMRARLAR